MRMDDDEVLEFSIKRGQGGVDWLQAKSISTGACLGSWPAGFCLEFSKKTQSTEGSEPLGSQQEIALGEILKCALFDIKLALSHLEWGKKSQVRG